jgi:hypothetical protein
MRSKGDQSRMLWCGAGMVEEKSPDRTRAGLAICGTRVTIPPSQVLRMLSRVPTDWSCPSRRPWPPSSIWSSLSSLFPQEGKTGSSRLVTGGIARVGESLSEFATEGVELGQLLPRHLASDCPCLNFSFLILVHDLLSAIFHVWGSTGGGSGFHASTGRGSNVD